MTAAIHLPLTKMTSMGIANKGKRKLYRDRAKRNKSKMKYSDPKEHTKYIARFDTLTDELGNHISKKRAVYELEKRMALAVDRDKPTSHFTIPYPHKRTEEARVIVRGITFSRYGTGLVAGHAVNSKGEHHEHDHFQIINDIENHPLKDLHELQNLREEIGKAFMQAGISYDMKEADLRPKRDQGEIHLVDSGRKSWKAEDRQLIESVFRDPACTAENWQELLEKRHGIKVVNESKNNLTFQDSHGMKVRLSRLFTRMNNRNDVISYLSINNQPKEEVKMTQKTKGPTPEEVAFWEAEKQKKLVRLTTAEAAFERNYARATAALATTGLTLEEIAQKINPDPMPVVPDSENINARWTALKTKKEALEKGCPYDSLYQLERSAKRGNKGSTLSAGDKAYALDYARKAAALLADGLTPEQVLEKLGKRSKDHDAFGKNLSNDELFQLERSAKNKGLDLSKALSQLNPSVLNKCAEGDPMPLIMMLSNIIGEMAKAAILKKEHEAHLPQIKEEKDWEKPANEFLVEERARMKRAEEAYTTAYARRAAVLTASGEMPEDIQKKLGTLVKVPGESINERHASIKKAQEHLEEVMPNDKLLELEKSISKKFTLPENPKGMDPEKASDIAKRAAANATRPNLDTDVTTSAPGK